MGFLRTLFNLIKNIQRSLTGSHPVSQLNLSHESTSFATEPETIIENTWVIPTYQGRAICDYTENIARYKREGDLNEALTLALGCLNSMRDAALSNHDYVMRHYVVQTAILQHKMKKYADEVDLIKGWLDEGIPPPGRTIASTCSNGSLKLKSFLPSNRVKTPHRTTESGKSCAHKK